MPSAAGLLSFFIITYIITLQMKPRISMPSRQAKIILYAATGSFASRIEPKIGWSTRSGILKPMSDASAIAMPLTEGSIPISSMTENCTPFMDTSTRATANMRIMMGMSALPLAGIIMKPIIKTIASMKPMSMNFTRPILSQIAPAMGAPIRRVP